MGTLAHERLYTVTTETSLPFGRPSVTSHTLLGLSSLPNTLSTIRCPVSWRSWVKYWRSWSKMETSQYTSRQEVLHSPDSPLLAGLAMKELRGNPLSPGMSKLDTANVAKDFWASFLLGHYKKIHNIRPCTPHLLHPNQSSMYLLFEAFWDIHWCTG